MQINITGQEREVTQSLREYVSNKFSKLERLSERINNVRVVLNVQKTNQTAEATISLSGKEVYAKSEHVEMYAAIDTLIDKLDRQLIKHKQKLTNY
ncbi:MAG: ribosome-associated translation inhibitor RaiA [Shewanella sp.]|nr:ribosome-associated translation inhibitor RaiA [Shewanella sp.]